MHIIITGGSGYIGTKITERLLVNGHQVTILDRVAPRISHADCAFIKTDFSNSDGIVESVCSADAIIHLAGASIFNRWTPAYKQEIIDSRINSAAKIFEIVSASPRRPSVFISASAVGYYGDQGDTELTENAPAGTDFLADVCVQWEAAAQRFTKLGMRTVSVRTAIVLGPGGGMMSKIIPLFKYGLGGKLGTGKQWFPWIHIDDLVSVYVTAIIEPIQGPINAVAPRIVQNTDFTMTLAHAMHRPALFKIPAWALRMVLGEFSRAVLSSQKVIPAVLSGKFTFQYPTLDQALIAIGIGKK
jgi:uncharacterized protein (TIGR01777 family)